MGKVVSWKDGLNDKLKAALGTLNEDDLKVLDGYKSDEQRVSMLETISHTMIDADQAANMKVSEATQEEREEYNILKAGGMGLKAGNRITARFLGTEPMFSENLKENWKTITVKGKTFYINHHFMFETLDGKEKFGIFASPMLTRTLSKVRTHASNKTVTKNPIVVIEYFGLVKKDELKANYNFTLVKGNEAHAFRVKVEDGVVVDGYASGVLNYLSNPIPSVKKTEDVSSEEKMSDAWNRLEQANGNTASLPQANANQIM